MKQTGTTGVIVDSFSREKHFFMFGGTAEEQVLVRDTGEEINLGSAPMIGREMMGYNIRPAEVLDAAGVEVVSIDEADDK